MEKRIYGNITAFYALSLSEFHMNFHSHKSNEIMYVTSGQCTVHTKDSTHSLGNNQFIFIRSHVPHRLEINPDKPCSILNLEFSFTNKGDIPLEGLLERSADFKEFWKSIPSCFYGSDSRDLGYALKDLISHIQRFTVKDDFLLELLMSRTMVELAFSITSRRNDTGLRYLRKACGYIDKNLHSDIKIPEIASYVGISRSYLQALFSEGIGCSITEYATRKRMEEAVFLLVNSTLKIIDIAFAVGYNSRQHFAHTFEKIYGMGPYSYRKTHMKILEADTEQKRFTIEDKQISSHILN